MKDTYTHAHSRTAPPTPLSIRIEEEIGSVDRKTLVPAMRARIERLRWLYSYVDMFEDGGVSSDQIKMEMTSRFGLTVRKVDEYIETLAARRMIILQDGVWLTVENAWKLIHPSSTRKQRLGEIERIIQTGADE